MSTQCKEGRRSLRVIVDDRIVGLFCLITLLDTLMCSQIFISLRILVVFLRTLGARIPQRQSSHGNLSLRYNKDG